VFRRVYQQLFDKEQIFHTFLNNPKDNFFDLTIVILQDPKSKNLTYFLIIYSMLLPIYIRKKQELAILQADLQVLMVIHSHFVELLHLLVIIEESLHELDPVQVLLLRKGEVLL
jgi:hypothetical protein